MKKRRFDKMVDKAVERYRRKWSRERRPESMRFDMAREIERIASDLNRVNQLILKEQ